MRTVAVAALVVAVVLTASKFAAPTQPARDTPRRTWAMSDSIGDGTPDFLRLHSAADREAFRRWFTFLSEMHFFRSPSRLPREINDCAALVRFAYREALRDHDGTWASGLGLDDVPASPAIEQYNYPRTPLVASLFRVKPGPFHAADLAAASGAFAEFADAESLRRFNTWRVSDRMEDARPGDLLFFRQLDQRLPFHVMIYLGPGQHEPAAGPFVVYHTGPIHGEAGEIRRPSVEELQRHPNPQWRPVPGNPNFLGVYRWNILGD